MLYLLQYKSDGNVFFWDLNIILFPSQTFSWTSNSNPSFSAPSHNISAHFLCVSQLFSNPCTTYVHVCIISLVLSSTQDQS